MDSWALFFIFTVALSVGLAFSSARAGRGVGASFGRGTAGYFIFAAGAVYMTLGRDELGLALLVIIFGLPLYAGAALLGAVVGTAAAKY